MYCGDETGSFIGDIGSYSARFGYGGNNVPSYVVPSMVLTQQQQQQNDGDQKILKSSIPTSCYNYKYVPPHMDTTSIVYDYRAPMRRVHCGRSSTNTPNMGPMTDPTCYLQQGDSIDDWDAYEHLWMNAMDTLSVTNRYKHTTGRVTVVDTETATPTTTTTHPGGLPSTTIRSGTASSTTTNGDHHCTHPFLVVSPGITHSMYTDTDGVGNNNNNNNNHTSLSAMHRSKKEILHITELMMETMDAPAMFIAPTPMLSSFAHGRQTSLIVDIGASGTRVTPVVDGLLLKQSQRRSGRGNDWLQNCIWQALLLQQQQQQQNEQRRHRSSSSKSTFHLNPRYQIKHQRSSSATSDHPTESPPPPLHDIFHRWAMNDLMYEIRTCEHVALPHWWYDPSVPFIYDDEDDDDEAMTMDDDDDDDEEEEEDEMNTNANSGNHPYHELPDGTRIQLSTRIGKDICRVPELFFSEQCPFTKYYSKDHTSASLLDQHVTLSNAPLHQLIHQSLGSVADVDLRRDLASSIVLTGGGSASLHNLASRLSLELPRITSSAYKTKVMASGYGTTISNNNNNNNNSSAGTNPSGSMKSHQSTSIERQCAAWIGGSILTSLGSFQQLWLSKAEYDEYGGTLATQRFP